MIIKSLVFTNAYVVEMICLVQARNLILGTGWPNFLGALRRENIIEEIDNSLVMRHTEIIRGTCGAHLGHVFGDGPEPTGLR